MKKYDVYGIGNALVDYEYEVTEATLKQLGLDKGLMTLIEAPKENQLLAALEGRDCKMACGGSAANTVIGLAQFGGKGHYACKVATDPVGDFFTQDLKREGVSSNVEFKRGDGVTGKCFVFVTPDTQRTMATHLGITQNFGVDELLFDELKQAEYLYIEGYLVASPTGKAAAIKARQVAQESGVKVALTFSDPNMVTHFNEGMKEILGGKVDLIFCNRDEAFAFVGTHDIEVVKKELKNWAHTFCITSGPEGSIVYDGNDYISIAGVQVDAVDSLGAGDMYAAGFLYGLCRDKSYEQAGRLASNAAAQVVAQFGPRLQREKTHLIGREFIRE